MAAKHARKGNKRYPKKYLIGAVGIRKDGAIVNSFNIPQYDKHHAVHAEARLCKKLDVGSTVFVTRLSPNNSFLNSKPCRTCRANMQRRGVVRCYYSINDNEYGVITF